MPDIDDIDIVQVTWHCIDFKIAYDNETDKFSLIGRPKLPPRLKAAIQEWCLQFHNECDLLEYLDTLFPSGNS